MYEKVWKEDAINTETVMVHIRNLREKNRTGPEKATIYQSRLGCRL